MQGKDLNDLKQQLDIVSVAEMYGELKKTGANFCYKDDKSIVINPAKQIFSDFNGNITGGSVLDLIAYMEKLELKDAIKRLKELAGADTYKIDPAKQLQRKKEASKRKNVDFQKLGYYSTLHLKAIKNFNFVPVTVVDESNKEKEHSILIPNEYQKLFEANSFPAKFQKKLEYLTDKILGFDNFFKCPSIILRDVTNRVVDIISYRPNRPQNYEDWSNPKYIYKNSHNRGKAFLFPFQKEFEAIIKKQEKDRYFIVGEGIKNGLNALLYSTPYLTLESTTYKLSETIKNYITDLIDRGYSLITMFDGDEAGKKAYNKFVEDTGLEVPNFFEFDSGLDFVEYLQGGAK